MVLSAFFSGAEIAYVAADRLFLELRMNKGSFLLRQLKPLMNNPAQFLSTTLIGNNLVLTIYGYLMAKALQPYLTPHLDPASELLAQTVIATLIILATAEFLPKSLILLSPNKMLLAMAFPLRVFGIILYPFAYVLTALSKFTITKIFKVPYENEKPSYGLVDFNNYLKGIVQESADQSLDIEAEFLNNALEFKTIQVRECMQPRTELLAIEQEKSILELRELFIESGYSKILIYKESIDNIIGYCHSSVLFKKPEAIRDILTGVDFVPETTLANELLVQLLSTRKSIAVVVDEFGGTSGIVTVEDIIEEIFGEIEDEHDEQELFALKLDAHNFVLSARHEIDHLNERFHFKLPEGDYETLSGLILSVHGDIPKTEDIIETENFIFSIKAMDGIKLDRVKMTIKEQDD